jgi:hypothetical protein
MVSIVCIGSHAGLSTASWRSQLSRAFLLGHRELEDAAIVRRAMTGTFDIEPFVAFDGAETAPQAHWQAIWQPFLEAVFTDPVTRDPVRRVPALQLDEFGVAGTFADAVRHMLAPGRSATLAMLAEPFAVERLGVEEPRDVGVAECQLTFEQARCLRAALLALGSPSPPSLPSDHAE